ncbi:ACP phosphodiesterase [Psychromonas sp. psych-6C06]|uniref:acyl carrier protein phosphodiesterase n=1 Tax=Psychromonas sp. psych-6C06 TaxID=2058089 RepID=UPI000C34CBB0|nr:ACP phosphodiesterase [Psychromonas sp. psych-6C06]PKF61413.1 ACP phosphodiesterase [Psychromonas sp. psych-6C06]
MNYLAHLHIAEHTHTSLLGNFLGDFVKGNPDEKFNHKIVQGIRLHRFVDSYTDQHPLVKTSKLLFEKEIRRFSPIALDMFWDHCLAKHWHRFHDCSLEVFSQQAQRIVTDECKNSLHALPARFEKTSQLVWQGRWFEHYVDIKNIEFALQRIATRSPRMAPLASIFTTLEVNYQTLTGTFFELYPDVLEATLKAKEKETD